MSQRDDEKYGSEENTASGQAEEREAPDMSTKSSRAAATNQDFEDMRDGKNQAHGHPREERGGSN